MYYQPFLLLSLVFCLSQSKSIGTIFEVYDQLEKAVSSPNATLCDKLIEKHYLTENKDDAIWTHVMRDSKEILNREFPIDDYITMEKDIRSIKHLWNRCKNEIDGKSCKDIFHILHDGMKDFRWHSQEWQIFYRVSYFSIRIAYQSLVLLMFSSMTKKPWVNQWWPTVEFLNNIHEEYNEMTKPMILFRQKLQEERPYEIGEAEVCELKRFMWREFLQPGCEKRWNKNKVSKFVKRAVVGENDEEEGEDSGSGAPVSDDVKSFYETFTKPDTNIISLIGGKSSEYDIILQSRYTDFGGKKVIVTGEREFSIREKSKADVIEEVINLTVDERDNYVKKKVKELDIYMGKTYEKVQEASLIFVKELKKKKEYWKGPINNDEHQHKIWF